MMNLILALILIQHPGTILCPEKVPHLQPMMDLNLEDTYLA